MNTIWKKTFGKVEVEVLPRLTVFVREGINALGPEIRRREAIEDGNIWNDLCIEVWS